ncbi:MAG: ATP-grasp domain-containing protein [Burkholderiaceae bacterium]|nr:ATP-grasp domain-containing protein [Burkholderiaceae bacterium]
MTARCIVLIGLSVRAAAEAARRDGWQVLGLDAFGDADTRAACHRWARVTPIRAADAASGSAAALWQLDLADLDRALRRLDPAPGSWLLAGSGLPLEGATLAPWLAAWQADLGLRWAGTAPAQVAALRDPRRFFAALDALQIAHPPLRFTPPADDASGWLRKEGARSGGLGVQVAGSAAEAAAGPGWAVEACADAAATRYWQRWQPGEPLSVTGLGDGQRAALLGLNRQRLAPTPGLPWRFGGVVGPLPWPDDLREPLQSLADRLVARFRLRGLFSLDGIGPAQAHLGGPVGGSLASRFSLLEVNPRWPASAQLYAAAGGLVDAVIAACQGRLPDAAALTALRPPADAAPMRGWALAYAEAPLRLSAARRQRLHRLARGLAADPGTAALHDLPPRRGPEVALAAGDPVCSVSAAGCDPAQVEQRLAQRLAQVRQALADDDLARPARPHPLTPAPIA